MASYPIIPELLDPYDVKPQDIRDRKLIEHIYTLQKSSISQNEALFQKIINGMGDLQEWAASERSGNPSALLKKFGESAVRGNDRPALLLYPRIMKVTALDQAEIKIFMIMSFERGYISTSQQVSALRDINFPSIVEFYRQKAQNPRRVDPRYEESPGMVLTGGNYENVPNFAFLSAEKALANLANETVKKMGLEAQPFSLFRRDILYVAHDEQKLLRKIGDNFYLPAEGGSIPHDEVIFCYRVLSDAFEQFVRTLGKKQKKLGGLLKSFDEENPTKPDRRQKKERVSALIALFEKIIERNEQNPVFGRLSELMNIIKELIAELDKKFNKIAEKEIHRRVRELKDVITSKSVKSHEFTELDPRGIFADTVFHSPEYTRKHSLTVLRMLKDIQDFCYVSRDNTEESSVYFAYLPHLFRIEAEARYNDQRDKIALIEKMIAELQSIRPKVTSYRSLLKEKDLKLYDEAVKLIENKKRAEAQQRREVMEVKSNQDKIIAASAGFIGAVLAAGLYAAVADQFNILYAALGAAPAFLIAYGLSASVLGSMRKKPAPTGRAAAGRMPERQKTASEPPEDPSFLKELEILFPKNAENVIARIYSPKKLVGAIKELDRVKVLTGDEEVRAAIRDFQKQLMRYVVPLKIPDNLLPTNYSNFVLISKADFRSPDLRKRIAAHFKSEADKSRQYKQLNQKVVDYYQFIASEIEFNYRKYIKE